MAVKLNDKALTNGEKLIRAGEFVFDQRDAWSEDRPSAKDENAFIEAHGYTEYGKWYLGTVISRKRTGAELLLRKAAPANISTLT